MGPKASPEKGLGMLGLRSAHPSPAEAAEGGTPGGKKRPGPWRQRTKAVILGQAQEIQGQARGKAAAHGPLASIRTGVTCVNRALLLLSYLSH